MCARSFASNATPRSAAPKRRERLPVITRRQPTDNRGAARAHATLRSSRDRGPAHLGRQAGGAVKRLTAPARKILRCLPTVSRSGVVAVALLVLAVSPQRAAAQPEFCGPSERS